MNHQVLKTILFDQHEVIRNMKIISRECVLEKDLNYVLVGLRRAGKTTMLYSLVQDLIRNGIDWKQIIYINFEDERLIGFSLSDFQDILLVKNELTDKPAYYFFDEIQNIDGWERFARRMADEKQRVCITGSNARMLSREISTILGGRYIVRYVGTYSFSEFLQAKDPELIKDELLSTAQQGRILHWFDEYLHYGGFPEAAHLLTKRECISNIYQKVLLGDVAARNQIRNENVLRLLVKKIAESVCSEISYSKLHNTLKSVGASISKDTLIDYVSYLKDAYLLFTVKNYYAAFAERESSPRYYFNDNGLLNLFLVDKDSALFENCAAIYLKQKYQELYCLRSAKTGIDIDFYLPEVATAIQITVSLSDSAEHREIDNLLKLARSGSDARLLILTMSEETVIEKDGYRIEVLPLWKFLLKKM
ncbi:MAG: ATP-binding protein [Erysipelotrichaceae bacterium]|nr:ATP-binding protein [Erysipelotrichaceae bacterium]